MYQDINGKTGYQNLQGNSNFYGNLKLLASAGDLDFLNDGITEWIAPAKPMPTEAQQLIQVAEAKQREIRAGFDYYLSQPIVDVNGVAWNAGFDTAIKLDGARRFAETFGMTEVTFFDFDNQPHVLPLSDALVVIGTVAGDYQTALATKNELYNLIPDCTIPATWVQTEG